MIQKSKKRLSGPAIFDERLKSFELETRESCHRSLRRVERATLPPELSRLSENNVLSTLSRIGFDKQLFRGLFQMTAPAWKLIEPVGDNVELVYPVLMKNIGEMRRGIISDSRKNSRAQSILGEMAPRATSSLINRTMHPAKRSKDFDDSSLSWIILPRAYDHLEKNHSRYILIYIKYLDEETEIEFTKILTRIIIEFVGNYSLKFIDDVQDKNQMVDALFYAYAAMFWKNLRNPPNGLEDGLIFENFFRWAKMIQDRFAPTDSNMARTTEKMETEKEKIFPVYNAFGFADHRHYDIHRFLVALRHGISGVESVVRYFGIGGPLLKNRTDGRLPYVEVPKKLNVLFRLIKKRYSIETPGTKKSIREFLSRLGSNYNLKRISTVFSGDGPSEALRFVGPRVQSLILDLNAQIAPIS